MSDQSVLIEELFNIYAQFASSVKTEGVQCVLDDLRHFYPDAYDEMVVEFKRRQRIQEMGVLLAGSM